MRKTIVFLLAILIAATACKKNELGPLEKNDATPPAPTQVSYQSLPGAVKISYSIPAAANILYVEGTYKNKAGAVSVVKASYYTNSLTIEGFADTDEYEIDLYAVSRSEVKSAQVKVKVHASTPPVQNAFKSLVAKEDFGGINVSFNNSSGADIAVIVGYVDSTGSFVNYETFYTKLQQGSFTARGFPSRSTQFGVYIRDRWNNLSDTLKVTLTPIFEKQMDKALFRQVKLPGDISDGWGLPIPNLWDGRVAADGYMWHSADGAMPMYFTFDMGVLARLSRFTLWQRSGSYLYNHGNPKRYEVWGSDAPPADGSWNNWTLLASCVSVKPSGNPPGSNTADDIAAAAAGEQTNVPLSAPKVRYIRVKVLETWSGGIASHISEMTFWGNDN